MAAPTEHEHIPHREDDARLAWYLKIRSPPLPPAFIRAPPSLQLKLESRYCSWETGALSPNGFTILPPQADAPQDSLTRIFIPLWEFRFIQNPQRNFLLEHAVSDITPCYVDFFSGYPTLYRPGGASSIPLIRMLRLTEDPESDSDSS